MKIKITKSDFFSNIIGFLVILFCSVLIFQFLGYISILLGNIIQVLIGSVSILICILSKGINHQTPFLVFVFVYTFFGVTSFIYNGNADIQELLWPLAFMGLGL